MMNNRIILYLVFLQAFFGNAQQENYVRFIPVYDGKPVELNQRFYASDSSWITVTGLRFYVGNLTVFSKGSEITDPSYYLIDAEEPESLVIPLGIPVIDSLHFLIGTDSLTNVSGILDGALDPTRGMYWAWNSGYINFKLQGNASASSNPDWSFEFHIGGYLPPFQTARRIAIPVRSDGEIRITIELKRLMEQVDLQKNPTIMIPGKAASAMADVLPSLFKMVQNAE
jgi:hypothetical protein